ncbi:ABC transporter substrate-binding protein [Aquirhabdus sp.]|uniref:ABC transporter substrate-binding protein n=1 Tax=Aquirhabdus sp. TaxID=2824160 RepID=UPI00396CD2E9
MKAKNIVSLSITGILAGLALLPLQRVDARSLSAIEKDHKIIIATEGQFTPFNYFQAGKLTGFEIDIANAVAQKMGLSVEWKSVGFDALIAGLQQDRWDLVIASHGITESRAKVVTFTTPHYCTGGVIVSKDPAIRSVANLAGKNVVVQVGTSYLENLKKVPNIKDIKTFPKDTDAQAAVTMGRADAWVSDKFLAKAAIAANPASGLKIGDFVFVEKVGALVSKGNIPLAEAYNKAFNQILADGTYAAISNKYFKEDIRCK